MNPFNTTVGDEDEPVLFIPQKGSKYCKEDYKHVCKQQPIPLNELPRYLRDPTIFPKWEPPTLWLGWVITEEDLLKLVEAHYPERLIPGGPSRSSIYDLPEALCEEFHVDPKLLECVDIAFVARQDGEDTTALSVGCTAIGVLDEQTRNNIQAKFGLQRPPEWLLDHRDWKWTRRTVKILGRELYIMPDETFIPILLLNFFLRNLPDGVLIPFFACGSVIVRL
ncbi:hypothetical protein BDZ89DRAFT_1131734 [Hymenopellis radicata]|nr:hypothetical protein BDZ89DRAFT_1131734 [Hymenopellis radicata]